MVMLIKKKVIKTFFNFILLSAKGRKPLSRTILIWLEMAKVTLLLLGVIHPEGQLVVLEIRLSPTPLLHCPCLQHLVDINLKLQTVVGPTAVVLNQLLSIPIVIIPQHLIHRRVHPELEL